jgi:hypothetical protein
MEYYNYIPEADESELESFLILLEEIKRELRNRLDEDSANQIISKYLNVQTKIDRDSLYNIIMSIIPDVIGLVGIDKGLTIGQDLKNIYRKAYR